MVYNDDPSETPSSKPERPSTGSRTAATHHNPHPADTYAGGVVPPEVFKPVLDKHNTYLAGELSQAETLTQMAKAYQRFARTTESAFSKMYKRTTVTGHKDNKEFEIPYRVFDPDSSGSVSKANKNGKPAKQQNDAVLDTEGNLIYDPNASYVTKGVFDLNHPDFAEREWVAAKMHEDRAKMRTIIREIKDEMKQQGLLTTEQELRFNEMMQPPRHRSAR